MGTGVLRLRSRVGYLNRVSKGSLGQADRKGISRPLPLLESYPALLLDLEEEP